MIHKMLLQVRLPIDNFRTLNSTGNHNKQKYFDRNLVFWNLVPFPLSVLLCPQSYFYSAMANFLHATDLGSDSDDSDYNPAVDEGKVVSEEEDEGDREDDDNKGQLSLFIRK